MLGLIVDSTLEHTMSELQILSGSWQQLCQDAKQIRTQVFIQEQQICPQDEWDAQDASSTHFVAYKLGMAMGTARLLADHHIGRVAILNRYRGLGAGKALIQYIIEFAKQQQRPMLHLSAQVHAIDFYAALGFVLEGEVYMDCGILHVDMQMQLI